MSSREGGDTEFVDDFSDLLLLKLFDLAIAGCHDNDKVKYNTVRALGSLLHYLPPRSVGEFMSSVMSLSHLCHVSVISLSRLCHITSLSCLCHKTCH